MKDFNEAFGNYVKEITEAHKKYYADNFPNLMPPTFPTTTGKKYIKIISQDTYADGTKGAHRSVHCFVDLDGNIYKADTWSRPAKGVRGSIYADKKPLLGSEYYNKYY